MSYAVAISEDNNIGSVRAIALAHARQLSSVNPVAFLPGFDWLLMDYLPESASVKDTSKDTNAGTEYSYSLVFAFNKQNVTMYNTLAPFIGITGVVMVTDGNGITRILGTKTNPVTIKHDADTGQTFSSLNYYKISVTWTSERPALVVA